MKKIENNISIDKVVKSFANNNRIITLYLLDKKPDLSLEDIAREVEIEYKTIASHVNKLAIGGLIIKKYHSHKVLHKLTSRGSKVLKFLRTLE